MLRQWPDHSVIWRLISSYDAASKIKEIRTRVQSHMHSYYKHVLKTSSAGLFETGIIQNYGWSKGMYCGVVLERVCESCLA